MESTTGQSSFLRVSRCLAVVGVVIAGFSGCAAPGTSTPRDWEPISADEASLVLYAPGLGSPRVSFKRRIDGLKVYELGHWRPTVGASPEAKIILFRFKSVAPSSMTFVREPSLEERIRRWLSSENIEMGASGKYRNVLGGMEYARFTRDGATQCVFMRQFGDTYSDQRGYFSDGSTGHGNIMIRGYYCVAPFYELSRDTLEGFLAGIGLKGIGVPEEPLDLTLTAAPIAGAAAASGQRQSASSGAFPYAVKFTSMVLRASTGSKLADDLEQVSLDHGRVYIHVRWRGLTMERHRAELRVFDGGGHKVKTSDYAFPPASPHWETWWSYNIDPDVDDPGSWRFEIDLDDETLVQKTLTVIPPARGPARSGTTTASRDAALGAYQNFIEAPRYKAFVRNDDGAWAWRIRETFYSAQLEAIQACQERSREGGQPPMCRIYAAGADIIWNLSEKEREDVIKAYKE